VVKNGLCLWSPPNPNKWVLFLYEKEQESRSEFLWFNISQWKKTGNRTGSVIIVTKETTHWFLCTHH
jgi:hypothetical protein